MQYYGGKHRTGKAIASLIESLREGREVYEPFCGALNVTRHLSGVVQASDNNRHLVDLWQRCRAEGTAWLPDAMTEEEYYAIRTCTSNPPGLLAFAMIGCGFGGKWGQGYARSKKDGRSFSITARKSIEKKMDSLSALCSITHASYDTLAPHGAVVYCDPPYAGAPEGYLTRGFDCRALWEKVRAWSKDNIVLVSECVAPPDFEAIWEKPFTRGLRKGEGWEETNIVTEKVFRMKPQP